MFGVMVGNKCNVVIAGEFIIQHQITEFCYRQGDVRIHIFYPGVQAKDFLYDYYIIKNIAKDTVFVVLVGINVLMCGFMELIQK